MRIKVFEGVRALGIVVMSEKFVHSVRNRIICHVRGLNRWSMLKQGTLQLIILRHHLCCRWRATKWRPTLFAAK